jgi:hypothetical protein
MRRGPASATARRHESPNRAGGPLFSRSEPTASWPDLAAGRVRGCWQQRASNGKITPGKKTRHDTRHEGGGAAQTTSSSGMPPCDRLRQPGLPRAAGRSAQPVMPGWHVHRPLSIVPRPPPAAGRHTPCPRCPVEEVIPGAGVSMSCRVKGNFPLVRFCLAHPSAEKGHPTSHIPLFPSASAFPPPSLGPARTWQRWRWGLWKGSAAQGSGRDRSLTPNGSPCGILASACMSLAGRMTSFCPALPCLALMRDLISHKARFVRYCYCSFPTFHSNQPPSHAATRRDETHQEMRKAGKNHTPWHR